MNFEKYDSGIEPSIDFRAAFEVMPGNSSLIMANPPRYTILAVTNDFLRTTGMQREDLLGKDYFDPFPESPDDPDFTGEKNVRTSLDYVITGKVPHELAVQRYDLPNGDGTFTERYWRAEHRPVLNQEGEVVYVIQTSVDITDQVKASQREVELKDIEKAYNLFMQTPVIIGIVKGDDYVIELANEELLIVWNRTAEVVGKPLLRAIPELAEQGFKDLLDQVRTTGVPFYANEYPIDLLRNGQREVRYLNFVYKPFYEFSADTVATGVFALGHDVTEQVQARQKIKESEEEMRLAIDIAELGTFYVNLLTYTATYSERVMKWLGLAEQGLDMNTIFGTIHPDDQQRVIENIRQTTQSPENSRHDLTYKVADPQTGAIRYLHSVGETMYNEQQQAYKIIGVIQDVSAQIDYLRQKEEKEKELKQSNERFELVSKATQDSIWDWDITTGEMYRDAGFTNTLGFEPEELSLSMGFWLSLIHPDDARRVSDSIQQILEQQDAQEVIWEQEYRIRRKSGEYAYARDRGIVLKDPTGKAIRMIGALRDVSEHHYYLALEKLEREILQMNVVKKENLHQIVEYYLQQIESLHPGMLCSILEVKNNRAFNLASPNLPSDYLNSIEGAELGEYAGSCGTAAYLKEKVIVTDIQNDIRWTGHQELAAEHNLRACWSHPILDAHGTVIATFACYYREPKSPSVLEENTIKRTSNILQVILESYQKEKALQKSTKRYELVTKATSDAIWDWNIPEDKIYFNDAYTQLFGYDNSILSIEKAWSSHVHEDDKQRVTDSLQKAFTDRTVLVWQEEYRFVRADGTIAYVHDRGIILRDEKGSATQMVGAMLDITERKQFESTLAQREEQFRTLANSIFQLAWMADANGWIHWYNDRWYDYTGTTLEDMQGWGWTRVHHPDHVERVVAFAKEAWQKGDPWELTFPLRSKDGTYRWFLTRGVPVKDKEGKVTQWIGTNTDIDAQKQAEALLEEKVKERTLELENKTRELEQFTYVSHHDLKEPIRKIQIFTEMIKSDSYDKLSEASRKRLDRVSDSAQRMNAALTDVLNFASLNQEEQPRPVDLNTVLDTVQSDLELLIAETRASVSVDPLPTIEAVQWQLHQLFYNLLSNAIKFSRPGISPAITITCQMLTPEQVAQHPDLDSRRSYYELRVQDNGIGFDQNYADKIFVIFQRLHSKDAYTGTGIGLALAKKVVMKHGGKIWAESKPGAGATFKVILPAN